ncbi:MAG TPA: thiamine diphosphokinase [Ignavibacteria bacterium]|nr:thiamine diphosphokinase [Ignavibacteria bacterium]HMR39951.1 thiamine diphosphokinase [Ignavibacteria bacterium]
MHTLIFLNGDPPSRKVINNYLKKSNYIIAADGGANYLKNENIDPDLIIGDLDSISRKTSAFFKDRSMIIKVRDQDTTDFEKSLLFCLKERKDDIIVFGVSGDRSDHTLNNFSILKRYYKKLNIRLISDDFEIFFINKKIIFPYRKNETVSLLGMPKASKVNSRGLKYRLKDTDLEFGIREGALNESTSSSVSVEFKSGCLLLFKKHFLK